MPNIRFLIVGLFILLIGCGGGQSPTSPPPPPSSAPDVTGNWYLTATSSVTQQSFHLDGSISDSQKELSATLWEDNANNSNCTAGFLWVFSGTESGTTLALSTTTANSQGNGTTLSGSLQASSDGNTVNGTYSASNGCENGDQGSLLGIRVPSVTGSWTGLVDAGPQTITVPITQAQAPGPSIDNYGVTVNGDTFPLSGTVDLAGWSCFTSGTLDQNNSVVQGNQVFIRVVANTGDTLTAAGVFNDPATAKSITLSYLVESGTCVGQIGNLTLNR